MGVALGVTVGVPVAVSVAVCVGVPVRIAVFVAVGVPVLVGVCVAVSVGARRVRQHEGERSSHQIGPCCGTHFGYDDACRGNRSARQAWYRIAPTLGCKRDEVVERGPSSAGRLGRCTATCGVWLVSSS
jgi:hypothetical protein